eukprot:GHUV01056767.1.p1 GENE.GHUV01056767.1~~GHUV01056767.1.p1  ORF type:complete len:149 (-),score=38.29 GHUV01056767.1:283-729(-)
MLCCMNNVYNVHTVMLLGYCCVMHSVGLVHEHSSQSLQRATLWHASLVTSHDACTTRQHAGEYNPESYSPKSPLPVTIKHKRGLAAADRPDSGHAVPGPGEYKLPSTLKGPAITMGQKLNTDSKYKQQQPGPGNYDVHESTIGVAGKS